MTDYTGSNTPADQRDLWRTPPALFASLDAEFCFQLDAAAAPHNALCRKFITAEQNTLETPWAGMGKKYGRLNKETWRDDLRKGFAEAFRVLLPHGVLIFKWNETQIPVSNILALTDEKPVIWQRTGKADKTHWVIFVKGGPHVQDNPA
jgi:hypothetical protein